MTLLNTPTAMRIALPQDTKDALKEKGIEAPDHITLMLTEATLRERQKFDADQKGIAVTDPVAWTKSLIMKRAEPGTDERVVDELLLDMGPSAIASISHAYVTGEVPDPKLVAQAVQQTLSGMSRQMLGALASGAQRLSSSTSTG
ncbi:hypothetical protein ACFP81_06380 [Deinococcus lacus]|uniref:Uncharacterized protein n=1 Tax=Deinococcus lacus TaxID=392561 RepID=A0ABW1YDV2_9DEIO